MRPLPLPSTQIFLYSITGSSLFLGGIDVHEARRKKTTRQHQVPKDWLMLVICSFLRLLIILIRLLFQIELERSLVLQLNTASLYHNNEGVDKSFRGAS